VLDGGDGDDRAHGGGGDDVLFGGVGADRLFGERGDDQLLGDPDQGDDYYTPLIRLRADRLSGGRGDDALYDTGGRNLYLGGPGRDVLEGGTGLDVMRAGTGADFVDSEGGRADRVDCGAGVDRARTDRRRDTRRRCERRSVADVPSYGAWVARVRLTVWTPRPASSTTAVTVSTCLTIAAPPLVRHGSEAGRKPQSAVRRLDTRRAPLYFPMLITRSHTAPRTS